MTDLYPLISLLALPVIVYFLRELLTAKIRESVRADFESDLEELRSELRKNEEVFRRDLNAKDKELAVLSDGALAGRSQRQAIIFERKINALDSIWIKFNKLGTLKFAAQMFSRLNVEEVEKAAPSDPNIRQFVEALSGKDPLETLKDISATNEKIYLPDMVWAIFSAYSSILTTCYLHMKAMSLGMNEAGSYIKWDVVANLVKAVLPHQGDYIDKYGFSGLPHLLEEIETKMVAELRKALIGTESDEEAIKQSADILKKVDSFAMESKLDQAQPAPQKATSKQAMAKKQK